MDEYSPRQLWALTVAAMSAPLVSACAAAGWQWVLLAAAAAAALIIYMVWTARELPRGLGLDGMLHAAWGRRAGSAVLLLYWLWLILSVAAAARASAGAFPMDRAFPVVPLALLAISAGTAARGSGVACRFGGFLFLLLAVSLGGSLLFAASDVKAENLTPGGTLTEAAAPLAVLLLPAAGLFLRDKLAPGPVSSLGWYALAAGLAAAVSAVVMGSLGRPLALAAEHPFWVMSRGVSVFGVMERLEAVHSSLLAAGWCCLMAYLLTASQRAARAAAPFSGTAAPVWVTAAASTAAMWAIPRLPGWFWLGGSLLFWGILPVATLGVVFTRKIRKI